MMYVLARLLDVVARPSTLLLVLLAVGALLILRRSSARRGSWLLAVGALGFLAITLTPVGTWMMRPLEERFSSPLLPERVDGIIVLGGALSVDRSVDRGTPLLNRAANRMTGFVALAERYPAARLAFTGGNADPFTKKRSEAEVARIWFQQMGLGTRSVVFEDRSRNTYENAVFSKKLLRPQRGQSWLLVTSAADLPRAVGVFRKVGWSITPVPTDYHTLTERDGWLPGLSGLEMADWAAHEWIGLVYYYLCGWTSVLFPGSRQ